MRACVSHWCTVQVYLSGREVPSLYITYHRPVPHADQHVSVLARPLEAALQDTLFHPALSLPKIGGLAGGLGSHPSQTAPPSGKAVFLDEEAEQWMDAGGLQKLHAASHKVISQQRSMLRLHLLSSSLMQVRPLQPSSCVFGTPPPPSLAYAKGKLR